MEAFPILVEDNCKRWMLVLKIGTLGVDGTQIRIKWSTTLKKLKSLRNDIANWFQQQEDLE